jgi:hypothetical protein
MLKRRRDSCTAAKELSKAAKQQHISYHDVYNKHTMQSYCVHGLMQGLGGWAGCKTGAGILACQKCSRAACPACRLRQGGCVLNTAPLACRSLTGAPLGMTPSA